MARKKKKDFDAASLNKEQYIKDNYLVKEDSSSAAISNSKRTIVIFMLSFLLLCTIFVFYWTFFINPQRTDENINQMVESENPSTPSPTILEDALLNATPTPRPILSKYYEFENRYPDIVGWISIDNIKVDYPVVQSPDPTDPFKYIDKSPNEKLSDNGSIFLDIRNSIDAFDRHTIIYGHNMKNGAMFGQLDKYLSRSFFYDHLIIRYDTLYQELEWEVFNVFETTTDFYYIQTYFADDAEFVNLMIQCVYKSYYHDNQTEIKPEDRILTLSTCTNGDDDERLVVQAKLITPLEGEEVSLEDNTAPAQ